MDCTFYPGQKVVCVNDDPYAPPNQKGLTSDFYTGEDMLDGLRAGRIYTVKDVYIDKIYDMPCITVEEIMRGRNSQRCGNGEFGYFAFRFRPVKKRKTDISVFTDLLIKAKQPEDA